MAKDTILQEIKEAEANARKMVDDALKEKANRIAKARVEARDIIKEAGVDAHKSYQNTLRSAENELNVEKEQIISNGRTDADNVSINSRDKIDEAVENLINEFERVIHA